MATIQVKESFKNMVRKFFPEGYAWRRASENDSNLSKLCELIASEPQRLETRTNVLTDQFIHNEKPTEMLEEWEQTLGLPYYCEKSLVLTEEQRQSRVVNKFFSHSVFGIEFFRGLVGLFGYDFSDIFISLGNPPTCDSFFSDSSLSSIDDFEIFVSISNTGGVINNDLVCLLEFFTPAHFEIDINFK